MPRGRLEKGVSLEPTGLDVVQGGHRAVNLQAKRIAGHQGREVRASSSWAFWMRNVERGHERSNCRTNGSAREETRNENDTQAVHGQGNPYNNVEGGKTANPMHKRRSE